MKKVMFAAALAAGMVAFGDGVESGIVGYTTFEPGGSVKCMKGFNFQNTSGGAIDLQSIVAYSDGDIEGGDGAFKIWWWSTQSGNLGNKYAVWSNYWWDESLDDYVDAEDESEYCWVVPEDDDVMPVKWTKSFGVGEGFFVQAAVTAPSLMFPNPFYKAH